MNQSADLTKPTIEASGKELKRVFGDDYLFEIPAYQRPYTWTTEQATELLDVLLMAMGENQFLFRRIFSN